MSICPGKPYLHAAAQACKCLVWHTQCSQLVSTCIIIYLLFTFLILNPESTEARLAQVEGAVQEVRKEVLGLQTRIDRLEMHVGDIQTKLGIILRKFSISLRPCTVPDNLLGQIF